MIGESRDVQKPRSTSPIAIITLSNIEQERVVYIFRSTFISCTINPTISSLGGRVVVLGPISNSPITTNSISWRSQQLNMFTLVMRRIVAGQRNIFTSPFNTNSCSPITGGRVSVLLWIRFASCNISSAIMRGNIGWSKKTYAQDHLITWVRVDGIKIPIFTTFTTSAIDWVIVSGLKWPMSTTFLTQRRFKTFFYINFMINIRGCYNY